METDVLIVVYCVLCIQKRGRRGDKRRRGEEENKRRREVEGEKMKGRRR